MRIPTYMSNSSFQLFEKDIEGFYLKYLTEFRPPREPQSPAAGIGSGFDAKAKSELHAALFGAGADPKYSFETLFEEQVEPHNRDWVLGETDYVFSSYKMTGAYDNLLNILQQAIDPPKFEFDVYCELEGVPFIAKPDCWALLHGDDGPFDFVHDWKVNGYCSKNSVSPNKGYMVCVDGYHCPKGKQSRSHNKAHKQFKPLSYGVLTIDEGYLEDCSVAWADQLAFYSWSMGAPVGSNRTVVAIDQIVGKPMKDERPLLRVATFRSRIRKSYQEHLAKRLAECWEVINSGHIFRYLSEEDSEQCALLLDGQAQSMSVSNAEGEDFFNEVVRKPYRG